MPDSSASDAARRTHRLVRRLVRASRGGVRHAAVVRWVGQLALLDSWSPDSHRLGSPPAARRQLRDEWTRSGELTESQARALVALDETTPWQV
ncbi:hypothetical protein [Geodermatophilus sp. URMC 65]|jgi:hypothetical protein